MALVMVSMHPVWKIKEQHKEIFQVIDEFNQAGNDYWIQVKEYVVG